MARSDETLPEPGSIADVTARLAIWCVHAPKGFARVEYTSEFSRQEVVERLRDGLLKRDIPLHTVELTAKKTPTEVLYELRDQLSALPSGVVSISGFQTAFPPDVPFAESLRVLNFNRENLAAFPLRQIWWMTPAFADEFIRAVPDLNSWFLVRLNLTESLRKTSETMWTPLDQRAYRAVDKAEARKRADYLTARLREAMAANVSTDDLVPLELDALETLIEAGIDEKTHEQAEGISRLISERLEDWYQETLEVPNGEWQREQQDRIAEYAGWLARLLKYMGRYTEADPLYRWALAIDEGAFGPDHPIVATRLNNLALLLQDTNRLTEAEPLYRRALTIDERAFGPDHPDVARDINNLASLLYCMSRLTEAESLWRRSLEIGVRNLGHNHPNVATNLNNLASLLKDTNRLAEAELLYRQALEIDERAFGFDHPDVARGLNNLAVLLKNTNRLAEAEPLVRRALEISKRAFGPDHPKTIRIRQNLESLKELGPSPL